MSLQADGLKPCDRQVEQEEHGMQLYNNNNNNNKPITPTFVSSKSSSSSSPIIHPVNNPLSFIDDDLVTWLQYPLDDGVACPDMFQHWPPAPPPPSPAPLHPNNLSPSPVLTKDPPPHQNEPTLMVDIAPSAPPPLQVSDRCTSPVDETDHHNSNAHLNLVSHSSEGRIMQEVLKQRAADTQQHDPLFKHSNNLAPAALGAALRQVGDGDRQGAAKDSRKLLPPEDERGWAAKEAHLMTNADSHSRHSEKRKAAAGEDPDNNWTRTTQLRQQAQHEGLAHVNLPAQHNVVGSSSGNTLQKEASANFLCRKEKSLAGKDLSRKQSATTDGSQGSMNAQANRAADAALALGAGRAAGVIRPSGMEAFSKVRTSLQQPIRPSKLGSPPAVYTLSPTSPSGKYTSYPTSYSPPVLTPRGRAFGFRDFTLSSQPVQQTLHNAAQPYWFRPCANFPSMASQEHQLMCSNTSKNSHMESSTTALLASHGTEELSMGLKQAPRTEQAKDIGVGRSPAAASGLSLPYRDKKDDVVFSGGSETSESLKETFSGSKRKLDDSECQSEDAEGESAVNSQARSSSSKRTRANEVHNLSERRRRNRINDKMNALRELIPNATKSNKAALLDEAIDYLKSLQLQLQVMSMRTGVTLSPMVLPPGLPHMQMPIHPMGIGTTGGCSSGMGLGGAGSTVGVAMCDMTYGVPAGPLTSLTSPDPMMLQPSANSSNIEPQVITAPESASSQFLHPFVHASQPIFSFNMDMYNTYLQQQQLQQHLHHQEQLASPQVQASSQQPPSSQQQSHYQL